MFRFVGRVGAGTLCDEIHTPLDVKNLMLDTLSWVLLRPLAAAGQVDRLHRYSDVLVIIIKVIGCLSVCVAKGLTI